MEKNARQTQLPGLLPNLSLEELFELIEALTGLEVSIYLAGRIKAIEPIDSLPPIYRRHVSDFCRAVKNNRAGLGCGGHDSGETNRKAGEVGRPFVQICHAGVAEAIVPVFGDTGHLATVFVGQAVTEEVEKEGLPGIRERVRHLGVNAAKLAHGYNRLPHMSTSELLRIGLLVDAAIRGIGDSVGMDALEREIMLQSFPAIRHALDIIRRHPDLDVTEAEIAREVFLDPAYFSRLFKRVVGQRFIDYLTEHRIRRALQLLDKTDLSVWRISQQCGYSRQSYFTRRFKQVVGMSPGNYRNRPERALGQANEKRFSTSLG